VITEKENEYLTRVGPGTPAGELMRRYWHPVAAVAELERNATKRVGLLGEKFVLYRDRSGTLGMIEPQCAHRRVEMFYGIPEAEGLRCPYHGWLYNSSGACIEQPYEQLAEPDNRFREKISLRAHPVQELGGLIFAYIGPEPAPLLPRWEPLVRENSIRDIGSTLIPCNWLQIMENSLDPVHTEWLHGAFANYALEQQGKPFGERVRAGHRKIGFDVFEYGIIKRRLTDGLTEEDDEWARGHPILFPSILLVGAMNAANFQFRVPVDDEHTQHYFYTANTPGGPVPEQGTPPIFDVPLPTEENGVPQWRFLDTAPGQDIIAWMTQGSIARRDKEKLGISDTGVILFRKMLSENIEKVKKGEDPINTFRDPAQNVCLDLQTEHERTDRGGGPAFKYSPLRDQIAELFGEKREAGGVPGRIF